MFNKKISACIVTYNNEDIIYETIDCILKNTKGLDFTLYISDNCSSDETLNIVIQNFKDVVIINNNKNLGFGAAHNVILDLIESDFHFIINPDIRIDSNVIFGLSNYLNFNEDIYMTMPMILNLDGTRQHVPKRQPKFIYLLSGFFKFLKKYRDEYTMSNYIFDKPIDIDFCSGCFMALRSVHFKDIKGFDDRYFMYFEDADLTLTMKKRGRVTINPDFYVYHIWNRQSHRKFKYFKIQIQSMFKFFLKWKFKQ